MIRVIVVGEGQTEETFIREVVAPDLAAEGIFVEPRLIATSKSSKGGALSRDRVLRFLDNTLKERRNAYISTFFDLYRLDAEMPGVAESGALASPLDRASTIEQAIGAAVVEATGCLPHRFLPHIQPYEFEALLFSDLDAMLSVEPGWRALAEPLRQARAAAASPEHINDGRFTHPSARLKHLQSPEYRKTRHGPLAARRIGLERMAQECAHFRGWLERLRTLQPLD